MPAPPIFGTEMKSHHSSGVNISTPKHSGTVETPSEPLYKARAITSSPPYRITTSIHTSCGSSYGRQPGISTLPTNSWNQVPLKPLLTYHLLCPAFVSTFSTPHICYTQYGTFQTWFPRSQHLLGNLMGQCKMWCHSL